MKKETYLLCFILIQCTALAQTFGPKQIIDLEPGTVRVVKAGDLDGDGDVDLVIAATPAIAWYENLNGQGTFSRHVIDEGMGQSFSIALGRVDNSGSTDVVVSYFDMDQVGWYSNLGGGNFGPFLEIASGLNSARGVTIAPIDADTDNDLVLGVSNGSGLYWVENIGNTGNFGPLIPIDATISQARTQAVGDVDGDGDLDIVTNSLGSAYISWYENTDGDGSFGPQQVVDDVGLYENSVNIVDIDGDGDNDLLSQKFDLVIWRENLNGNGVFGPINLISSEAINISDVKYGDFDNDGDMDVISVSTDDDKVAWYENLDGMGNFGPQQIIDLTLKAPRTVYVADLDGDGDLDIISAALEPVANGSRELVWYENLTVLEVDELQHLALEVYPNPMDRALHVQGREPLKQVTFYGVLGQVLMTVRTGFGNIDVSSLPTGLYFVEVRTEKGAVVERVVKL